MDGTKPLSKGIVNEARELVGSIPLAGAAQTMRANRALKSYAIRHKATISPTESHFSNYSNAVSISNIKLKGYGGLSYLKYEYGRFHNYLNAKPGMSIIVVANVGFKHYDDETDEPSVFYDLRARRYNITNVNQLMDAMNSMAVDIAMMIESKQYEESGLHIHSINKLIIMYTIYDPTRAGSFIKLPKEISLKKACINIQNKDNQCFKYCVLCHINQIYNKAHPEEMHHYNILKDDLNWSGITFPVIDSDIDIFEINNKKQISINVY